MAYAPGFQRAGILGGVVVNGQGPVAGYFMAVECRKGIVRAELSRDRGHLDRALAFHEFGGFVVQNDGHVLTGASGVWSSVKTGPVDQPDGCSVVGKVH